jgi:hypothetical protein
MSKTPEGKIQAAVVKYAKGLGFLAKRNYNAPGAETGWPDTEFFLPGAVTLFFEFKRLGEEPTKLQAHRISQLRELGHHVYVCDDVEYGKGVLDAARRAVASFMDAAQLSEPGG